MSDHDSESTLAICCDAAAEPLEPDDSHAIGDAIEVMLIANLVHGVKRVEVQTPHGGFTVTVAPHDDAADPDRETRQQRRARARRSVTH